MYFGMLEEISGKASEEVEVSGNTTEALAEELKNRHEGLKNTSFKIAVDKRIVQEDINLANGAEIALLPPYSGG